ncbi:SMP-30/Gluconolaconase/LRE domain protein [Ancylobacter novellus DSM 506]|uniref:SMP-30/Gluconolaconase/LRE domain protein n=1 Tax=Ancylobacter novellus (strain ATCC 8093 / DSM 506 / JCM 20403 / CCM 1077 / IAM 12100 / NBRC 12443 / NCIMB 10456) TaxID=639283 RepID=D7A0U1_ANCN5|nr:SMP-30/Gluconolaconase/LRE domain protein [Ancylobacter novellus DSM 506]
MTITSAQAPATTEPTLETLPVAVLCEERCHLGEGPSYDAARDTAWWFDILEKRLCEARLAGGAVTVHSLPFMASALAMVDDRRQLLLTENGLVLRDIAGGRLEPVADIEAGNPATRSNDGRVHPSGTFWISTMGRHAEREAGTIYAYRDGAVAPLFPGITIPNAICFSPDGTLGYFADTKANRLHRVRLDPATGLPLESPSVLRVHTGAGGFDGAVTDAEDLVWCAIWGGGRLEAYTPAGDLVRSVAVPARQTSCPVFVGPAFDRVLVTSAFENMDEAARAADPHHGKTFLLDIGVRGHAEPRVRLGGA